MAFCQIRFGLPKGVLNPYPSSEIASIVVVKDRGCFDQDTKILIVEWLDQGSKREGKIGLVVGSVESRMVMIKETQAQSNLGISITFLDKIVSLYEFQANFSSKAEPTVKEKFLVRISPDGDKIAGILQVDSHTDLSRGDLTESQEKEGHEK